MEGATALATTRLFSSLQLQPYDTRLAASVEMFEVARPILRSYSYERTRRIPRADLERYNTGMAAWEEFWLPVLKRRLNVDPLAMSVLCPFAWFITLTYNATAYVTWKNNKGGSHNVEEAAAGTASCLTQSSIRWYCALLMKGLAAAAACSAAVGRCLTSMAGCCWWYSVAFRGGPCVGPCRTWGASLLLPRPGGSLEAMAWLLLDDDEPAGAALLGGVL